MNSTAKYYQIAVPSPLRRSFDYLPPVGHSKPLLPGVRVRVPFGRRQVVGVVIGHSGSSEVAASKLKAIAEVLDDQPLLSPTLFELFLWAARYYQHPIGEALLNTLPVLLRKGEPLPDNREQFWCLTTRGKGLPADGLKRAPRQQQLLTLLQQRGSANRLLLDAEGISRESLRSLLKKELVESAYRDPVVSEQPEENLLSEAPLSLYAGQQAVIEQIELHGYHSYLLDGETGSGKTEIYLQVIEKALRYGRQALVLVPEISLTPQTVKRFQQRFNRPLAVMHSGLTDRERLHAWEMARTGQAPIVIGTRSAVFTPLQNPGVIIVDEEHDSSFKQHEGFRYHARDLAVVRAHREQVPVILGSATPALESLHNCAAGRYQKLLLKGRPGAAKAPSWQVLDIRKKNLSAGFSNELVTAIGAELAAGNQALVFLNRRGFSPALMCHDCGWSADCHRCDLPMTVHRGDRKLWCHHCDLQARIPSQCPNCFSSQLQYLGQGTERGELELETLFPQFPVLRVDRDTTRRKASMQEVVQTVNNGEPCVLVGTQILAKGHHFPDVTLVAILDADGGLFSADFRAAEKMGQLITQVAGRAGRGDKPGRVILQTHCSDHPLIQQLTERGYPYFAQQLLSERRVADMPPYSYMALLRAEASNSTDVQTFLQQARAAAEALQPPTSNCRYLGPLPAPMEKRSGRYRYQLSLTFERRPQLQQLLSQWSVQLENLPGAKKVRWSLDVDPQDMV
ncbi:primosomal protein N' [Porticoccus sp. W117]|uniref:primosomal protein N' n=1 Tax=Porticoccus sp. W117 TaxID=3054777 RepID=UPI002591EE8F|nr:primosomal protein N' [Porticoccus sp. W117]MDM3872527.1 primosomal protein N' [Porticoccus sp. W117]